MKGQHDNNNNTEENDMVPTTCPECGRPLHRERIYNASHPGFGSDFMVCDYHGSHDGRWYAPEDDAA